MDIPTTSGNSYSNPSEFSLFSTQEFEKIIGKKDTLKNKKNSSTIHEANTSNFADSFELLLKSEETMHISSTPDRLKSIEVKKGSTKLEAKPAIAYKDGSSESDDELLGIKKKKEESLADFLKNTAPPDYKEAQSNKQSKQQSPSVTRKSPNRFTSLNNTGVTSSNTLQQKKQIPLTVDSDDEDAELFGVKPRKKELSMEEFLRDTAPPGFKETLIESKSSAVKQGSASTSSLVAPANRPKGISSSPSIVSAISKINNEDDLDDEDLELFGIKQKKKEVSMAEFLRDTAPPGYKEPLAKKSTNKSNSISNSAIELNSNAASTLPSNVKSTQHSLNKTTEKPLTTNFRTVSSPSLVAKPAKVTNEPEEDEDDELFGIKKKKKEESLAEFLKNSEPPPVPVIHTQQQKKKSGGILGGIFGRSKSNTEVFNDNHASSANSIITPPFKKKSSIHEGDRHSRRNSSSSQKSSNSVAGETAQNNKEPPPPVPTIPKIATQNVALSPIKSLEKKKLTILPEKLDENAPLSKFFYNLSKYDIKFHEVFEAKVDPTTLSRAKSSHTLKEKIMSPIAPPRLLRQNNPDEKTVKNPIPLKPAITPEPVQKRHTASQTSGAQGPSVESQTQLLTVADHETQTLVLLSNNIEIQTKISDFSEKDTQTHISTTEENQILVVEIIDVDSEGEESKYFEDVYDSAVEEHTASPAENSLTRKIDTLGKTSLHSATEEASGTEDELTENNITDRDAEVAVLDIKSGAVVGCQDCQDCKIREKLDVEYFINQIAQRMVENVFLDATVTVDTQTAIFDSSEQQTSTVESKEVSISTEKEISTIAETKRETRLLSDSEQQTYELIFGEKEKSDLEEELAKEKNANLKLLEEIKNFKEMHQKEKKKKERYYFEMETFKHRYEKLTKLSYLKIFEELE
ncbi:hypothetical protein HK099_000164, partial [Clydaea vesicula]